jgi:lysophospholipase L1-like esterase
MARSGLSSYSAGRRTGSRRRLLIARSTPAPQAEFVGLTVPCRSPEPAPCVAVEPGALVESSGGLAAVTRILRDSQPATWVFTGDSITHGALFTEGWRSFPEHFAERVRWELRRFHDVVINTGICGERSGDLCNSLEDRVLRFGPDVALVLIGMNDALAGPAGRTEFERNLIEIVGRIREAGTIPVLQTPNAVFQPNCATRVDLPAYVDLIRDVAYRVDVPLIDHWEHWQTRKPDPEELLAWLQDQSIHPNYLGHREMARHICHAFGVFDPSSMTCSLAVP